MKEKFYTYGVDYDHLLVRIDHHEQLAKKFLKNFITDATFVNLQKAYMAHDNNELLRNVHTLKGLSANLEMKQLYHITEQWTNDLRQNNLSSSDVLYQKCLNEYTLIIQGLKENFKD